MFNRFIIYFQSVVLMFLYVKQDVNLALQSCSGLKNWKRKKKNVKNPGKHFFAVRMEWVKTAHKSIQKVYDNILISPLCIYALN